MSFAFEWPAFSDEFYDDAREMLAQALNKGEKPPIIADKILVKELHMGTIPPDLEILEIGDLSTDRFRGIFRLTYAGDAYIVLQTRVQANPLNVPRPSLDILGGPRILFAAAPLVVPMTLRLSSLQLRAIVVLVVSRQKGITLVFKNDPLESVNVSSSFDGVDSVAGYIQREIEAQLREAFRSDLPSVIHRLSQKWLSGEVKAAATNAPAAFEKGAKIETRTAPPGQTDEHEDPRRAALRGRTLTTRIGSMSIAESVSLGSADNMSSFTQSVSESSRRAPRGSGGMTGRRKESPLSQPLTFEALQSVPEAIESYDPTYGLRPESIPAHASFEQYRHVVRSNGAKGLGDCLLDDDDEHDDEYDEADVSEDFASQMEGTNAGSFLETIPAVGGGTVTRPRIFHTQSQLQRNYSRRPSSVSVTSLISNETCRGGDDARSSAGSIHSVGLGRSASAYGGLLAASQPQRSGARPLMYQHRSSISRPTSMPPLSKAGAGLRRSESSSANLVRSTYPSPPSTAPSPRSPSPPHHRDTNGATQQEIVVVQPASKRPDAIDLLSKSPSSILNDSFDDELPIVLNAGRNESVAKLASLTSSNQTLSPFTREHQHVTGRSSPQVMLNRPLNGRIGLLSLNRVKTTNHADNTAHPVRATRKRVYRIGSAAAKTPTVEHTSPSPPTTTASSTSSDPAMLHRQRRSSSTSAQASNRRPSPSSTFPPAMPSGLSEISEYFPVQRAS